MEKKIALKSLNSIDNTNEQETNSPDPWNDTPQKNFSTRLLIGLYSHITEQDDSITSKTDGKKKKPISAKIPRHGHTVKRNSHSTLKGFLALLQIGESHFQSTVCPQAPIHFHKESQLTIKGTYREIHSNLTPSLFAICFCMVIVTHCQPQYHHIQKGQWTVSISE